ncbi:MAG TPA: TlpA disulfide reductase family protein [Rhizomicrobium sp.]|jgi:thiol-disulfide isomerase/thioredoxin
MSLNFRIVAIALAALILAGAGVLYVMHGRAANEKPAALATLTFDAAPITLPEVAFSDASGARHTLAAYRGRYVLLNLWATWCAPCVKELPALSRLQAALPTAKFAVVTVNVTRASTAADTAAFLRAHDAPNLPVALDSNLGLLRVFGEAGLPISVLIDPQGHEIARAGSPADWDNPAAIAYFKALTGGG